MSSNQGSTVPHPETPDALIPESDDSSEADSAIGGLSYASSTTSARSEVYALVEEFGRTYHGYKAGKYILPNDKKERDRLDLQHVLFLMTIDGKLSLAPLENPRHVLDIATGTGIWAMDFAEQYPNARVIGTDLSPIQPTYVPLNCSFEIHDAEDDWSFSHPFDYIHGRALITCFKDPKDILSKAYNSLAPGGYLELQDGLFPFKFHNSRVPEDNPMKRWLDNCLNASIVSGRRWDNVQHYSTWMAELGFVDIVERRFNWPCGPWAKGDKMKKLGVYFYEDLCHAVEPIALKLFTKFLGWDAERAREFAAEALQGMSAKKLYMFETVAFVYGRKPLDA